MKTRIPSAGTPLLLNDIASATAGLWRHQIDRYISRLKSYLQTPDLCLVNSGTTAGYITMLALAQRSSRREVIIPAYTAPSLTLPIRKAGLIPRCCEVSLETFNLDHDSLDAAITSDTLCVMPVHMFGLASDVAAIRRVIADRDIAVIDDAASSFGTTVQGKQTGTLGDVGFISFNRGKNLSTLVGGAVATEDDELFELIEAERKKLPIANMTHQAKLLLNLTALSVAVRPVGYTLLHALISRYKYTSLHTDFVSFQFPDVLAGAGITLMNRAEAICDLRHRNGSFLGDSLQGLSGIRTPVLIDQTYTVYNQFPVLVDDPELRSRLVGMIFERTGVEVTKLYPDPLHRIYDMGYGGTDDPFPNASYMSDHIILIPTHPLIDSTTLTNIVDTIRSALSRGA
ncbi:MAG: hypothetical protein HOH43_25055 [Candidatus Latescibacteria bacterium]|nr:hypothetical protein [Candidatus Latescibacterota bacterium]